MSLVVKCPLGARGRLLRRHRIESLLITIAGLEQRLEIVLLNFLTNHLLKLLGLEHLICVLLGTQLDQKCLVDPLQSRHFRVLCRICRMCGRFERGDIRFPLYCIGPDSTDGLKAAGIQGVREINRGSPRSNCLLSLRTERIETGNSSGLVDAG